jgi:hypothetical protein
MLVLSEYRSHYTNRGSYTFESCIYTSILFGYVFVRLIFHDQYDQYSPFCSMFDGSPQAQRGGLASDGGRGGRQGELTLYFSFFQLS